MFTTSRPIHRSLGIALALQLLSLGACSPDDTSSSFAPAGGAGGRGGSGGRGGGGGSAVGNTGGSGGAAGGSGGAAGGMGGAAGGSGGAQGGSGGAAGASGGAAGGSGGGPGIDMGGTPPVDSGGDLGPVPAILTPRTAVNLFLSGHSLINLDMPWNVQQLAMAAGQMHHYNEQMGIGSNMAVRIMGGNEQDAAGQRVTFNVLSEIRNAMTLPGGRKYDTLIITEASGISEQVRGSNTVGHSRSFYDALIGGNANGRVFLYDSWDASGGNIPGWINKIRRDHIWYECVASAVNKDPARARNPMLLMPAGMMLARVAEVIGAGQVPGVGSASALLSSDGHHASDLGNFLLAITTHAIIYGRMPESSAVVPAGRFGRAYTGLPGAASMTSLRNLVWEMVTGFYRSGHNNRRTMADCRQRLIATCASGSFVCTQDVNRTFAD